MLRVPSVLKISPCFDHQRRWRSRSPLTTPRLSKGAGRGTSATTTADQNAANAKRYVRLRPKGMAAPVTRQGIQKLTQAPRTRELQKGSPLTSKYLQNVTANSPASDRYRSTLSRSRSCAKQIYASCAYCIAKLPE